MHPLALTRVVKNLNLLWHFTCSHRNCHCSQFQEQLCNFVKLLWNYYTREFSIRVGRCFFPVKSECHPHKKIINACLFVIVVIFSTAAKFLSKLDKMKQLIFLGGGGRWEHSILLYTTCTDTKKHWRSDITFILEWQANTITLSLFFN